MNIRKAHQEDLPKVQELSAELFAFEQQRDPDLKMDWPHKEGAAYFAERIEGKDGVCFVAEENEVIVGYLTGAVEEPPLEWRPILRAEAENMLIKEAFRGQGIGSSLMAEFIAWAKERGAKRIFTSVYADNESSLRFHQHLGFKSYAVELEREVEE
jgi:ribosomal protein S18 acetylase RimI-like enzyme